MAHHRLYAKSDSAHLHLHPDASPADDHGVEDKQTKGLLSIAKVFLVAPIFTHHYLSGSGSASAAKSDARSV